MKGFVILTSVGFAMLGGVATAQSWPQPNVIQGTPGSVFPHAAPHEVTIVNGVPCRTVLVPGDNIRVPVACAGPTAAGGGPLTTGSIRPRAPARASQQ
jgi:hypothetical protein